MRRSARAQAGTSRSGPTSGIAPPQIRRTSADEVVALIDEPSGLFSAVRDEAGRIIDFRVDYANDAMVRLGAVPAGQLIGGRLLALYPALRGSPIFDELANVAETGDSYVRQALVHEDPDAASGPLRSVFDIRATKLGDGCFVSVRDLTARTLAERATRQDEERYRALVEGSSDAIFVLDADGRVAEVNPAGEQMLGYGPGGLVGCRWQELLTADDLAAQPLHLSTLRNGDSLRFERRMRHASGAVIHVELSAKMLPDGSFLEIARDVTARTRATEAVRRMSELLAATQSVARIGGWELDVARNELYWTDETYRLHDTSPEEYTPTVETAIGFYAPESIPIITAAVQRAIEDGTPYDLELELITAKGRRISVRATSSVRMEDGRTVKITGAFQDITERRRLEMQLLQSHKMEAIGQLAGGIAHDFNNLLTAIRGYAELARERSALDELACRDLDEVIENADRAASLVGQLLAFGRRQVLQPRVIDPATVVANLSDMLRRLLGEHIVLAIRSGPGLGSVEVDQSQLEQVIVNLAVNAADAMPDGGRLTIELADVDLGAAYQADHAEILEGPYVQIAVTDSGIGMDADTLTHIFEPFFTTKAPGRGTGLGLATVYGIVKQSGGFIYAYSEPGHGSTFKVYLPRVSAAPSADAVVASTDGPLGGTETILLVEDEPSVRGFARRTPESRGYTVLEAADGSEALAIAGLHPGAIDLLVTDVIMPGLQGHQLAEQLSASRPGVPVLLVSGFPENAAVRGGASDRHVSFLPKPYSADGLSRSVRQAIDASGRGPVKEA